MSRPESLLPPDLYYNSLESRKYTTSSRIQHIQSTMTHRALELLDLDSPSLVLDLGCGSGLSGEILSQEGHLWVGMDIAPAMLEVALQRQQQLQPHHRSGPESRSSSSPDDNDDDDDEDTSEGTPGDLMLADIGQSIPFRAGSFDAAISISAIQWLCNAQSSHASDEPAYRLRRFFDGLYASLRRGGRAVCQFYPRNETQRDMVSNAAIRAGFSAGILEDDGGTKNVKTYLVLRVGGGSGNGDIRGAVEGLEGVEIEEFARARNGRSNGLGKGGRETKKDWIMMKKEKMRGKGKIVKSDSKYSGRKRRIKF